MTTFKVLFPIVFTLLTAFITPIWATLDTFDIRYTQNLTGDVKIIGNTVLEPADPSTSFLSNNEANLRWVNIDPGADIFNASSATINSTQEGVDISNAQIVWAGLYWQGYLHNSQADTGIDTQYSFSSDYNTSKAEIQDLIQNQSIRFKVGNGEYNIISPDDTGQSDQSDLSRSVPSYTYTAFADVTSLVRGTAPDTMYTVANIPSRTGAVHANDGIGNFGAWALVVAYSNGGSLGEKTRNVTIYDGYTVIHLYYNPRETIDFTGFQTSVLAPNGVDAKISVFAGEGDKTVYGDYAQIISQDGTSYDLPFTSNAQGEKNYFDSTIQGVPNRSPHHDNNYGIDIHTNQVGNFNGAGGPIKRGDTTASLTLGTTTGPTGNDFYTLSMVAFSIEVIEPKTNDGLSGSSTTTPRPLGSRPSRERSFKHNASKGRF